MGVHLEVDTFDRYVRQPRDQRVAVGEPVSDRDGDVVAGFNSGLLRAQKTLKKVSHGERLSVVACQLSVAMTLPPGTTPAVPQNQQRTPDPGPLTISVCSVRGSRGAAGHGRLALEGHQVKEGVAVGGTQSVED